MLDDLVDSSDLEHPKMFHLNSQRLHDPTLNLGDNDNLPVRQEKYRKGWRVKGSKACKGHWNNRVEQVKRDHISEIKVRYILQ